MRFGGLDVAGRCYDSLLPYAGRVSVVSAFVCFGGAVDHHLGALVLALGNATAAVEHFQEALDIHQRLGATPWSNASRQLLAKGRAALATTSGSFIREGKVWRIDWRGVEVHVPDAKGLRDLAILLDRYGEEVPSSELYATGTPLAGVDQGDAIIDDAARDAYRARLAELDRDQAEAEADHDLARAEKAALERDVLIEELRRNLDIKGRSRRLGDTSERARKAVTARVRDAIATIEQAHPDLGGHLRTAVRTGTYCSYQPPHATSWTVRQI